MAGKTVTRGLNIVVDGKTQNFDAAMAKSTEKVKETKNEVNALKRSLLTEWDNKTFVNAQAAATNAFKATEEKVKLLKTSLNQLGEVDTQEAKKQIKAITVELMNAETAAKQAKKQLENINNMKFDRVTNLLGKIGDNMLKGGTVMTAGVTLPLAYVGKEALEAASDLVEVQNVVDVAFKDSAESVNKWSKSLLDSHGISELTAKQYSGLFKSMANGMEIVDHTGEEMSKQLTERMSDIASYRNLSFERAGTMLKSVFTGETESLKEIGVIMTEANLNAYALAHGMEEISDSMTQAEKVQLRYNFVMDATREMQGDFARTSDSTANQMKQAQERVKKLSIELAQELLPIANDLLKYANDCMKAFDGMSESQKRNIVVILGLAAGLGPVVTVFGGIVKAGELSVSAVKKVVSAINKFKMANEAAAVSQGALNTTMLASPYALIAVGILAVGAAFAAYSASLKEATADTKKLKQELDDVVSKYDSQLNSIKDSAQSKLIELDVTDKLINRYEELNGKVGITAAERNELASIVNQLNGLLGIEIHLVDSGTGAFDASAASLRNLTQARREEIEQLAKRDQAIAYQKALYDIEDQIKKLDENYRSKDFYSKSDFVLPGINKSAEMEKWNALQQAYQKRKEYKDKLDELYGATNSSISSGSVPNISAPKVDTKQIEDNYKKEKEMLDYRRQIGVVTEQKYYQELKGLKSKFFSDTEKEYAKMTDTERKLNVELYNTEVSLNNKRLSDAKSYASEKKKLAKDEYDKKKQIAKDAYEENKKLMKASYDSTKKELEDSYNAEIKTIESSLKAKESAINAEIKAIDKEIEARRRLKQEEEYTSKTDAIKAQLTYGKNDEFTQRELQAELARLEKEQADAKWELEQQNRKEALKEELDNAKEVAEQRKADLKELLDIQKKAVDEQYTQQIEMLDTAYQLHLAQLDAMFENSSKQMGQISREFVNTITAGCNAAASALRSAISDAKTAAQNLNSASSTTFSTTNRSASMNVYGSNYTDSQLRYIMNQMLYEDIN
ncbi:hypothetical protein RBG61_01950 [Paludicola sp. MB14-C6]|uniref:hypothetical protein n=1 Tax=Paludihabitans sp. MB14-C6 TaxID=3070656 RepID=UPI0027DBFC85|nr:hypothetical protein [Paludicola sp. MB14-C6]WMJ23454.1 hypothetical protein RBG61_01950 [Paludicola sp. MB14-C6]